MINTDPERGPGRPPKVVFPIRRTVVCHSVATEMILNENQTVRCLRCGSSFLVNSDTAFIMKGLDSYECVRCPRCRYIADAYYYVTEPPRQKAVYPKCPEIPWLPRRLS